jgi:hypothetical protein
MIHRRFFIPAMLLTLLGATFLVVPQSRANHSTSSFKWNTVPIDVDISDGSFPSSWISPLSASMTTWNNAGSRFRLRSGNTGHKLTRKYWYGGAVAETLVTPANGVIVDADTAFNTYYQWSIGGSSSSRDIQNVITHEFGHWVFLFDLTGYWDKDLTMYQAIPNGETKKRTLEWDDVSGVRTMYP